MAFLLGTFMRTTVVRIEDAFVDQVGTQFELRFVFKEKWFALMAFGG